MPKFLVKSNIQKDGKLYEPGAKIELSDKEAAEMPWAVEQIQKSEVRSQKEENAGKEEKQKA